MSTRADLIELAVGMAPAGQLARMKKEELELLVKGEPKKEDVEQVEVIQVPVNDDDKCAGCRHKGNKIQCGSCVNYRR